MTNKLDALLDARDRSMARAIDYDMQVLIVLLTIAATWGVLRGAGFEIGRLLEVMLAFAGLFVSIGWLIQRHLLRAANDDYAGAIRAAAESADPAAQESVRDRLALRPAGAGLRLGQVLSTVVFALLCALAVWTYDAHDYAYVAEIQQDAVPVSDGPPVVQVVGEVWLMVAGDPCVAYGDCEGGGGDFPSAYDLGYLDMNVAMSPSAIEFPGGDYSGFTEYTNPYGVR